jgi:hypothetical protein
MGWPQAYPRYTVADIRLRSVPRFFGPLDSSRPKPVTISEQSRGRVQCLCKPDIATTCPGMLPSCGILLCRMLWSSGTWLKVTYLITIRPVSVSPTSGQPETAFLAFGDYGEPGIRLAEHHVLHPFLLYERQESCMKKSWRVKKVEVSQ